MLNKLEVTKHAQTLKAKLEILEKKTAEVEKDKDPATFEMQVQRYIAMAQIVQALSQLQGLLDGGYLPEK